MFSFITGIAIHLTETVLIVATEIEIQDTDFQKEIHFTLN